MTEAAPVVVDDFGRYDRQERITWWKQRRLSNARVAVVGAGALGNEVVKNLALMGVGSILIIDHDEVEMSNLARCVLLRPEDEGRRKATVVAEAARRLNSEIEIVGIDADIRSFGTGLARRADVLVGALDNREARVYLNRLAWRTGRPWVDGAIEALEGVARVFQPPVSCYECTLTAVDWEIINHRRSCRLLTRDEMMTGRVPTTITTASIVAAVQAQEVVKLLHQDDSAVKNLVDGIVYSGSANEAYSISYPHLADCLAHHTYDEIMEVDPGDATTRSLLRSTGFDHGVVELNDDYLVEWRCSSCGERHPGRGPLSLATVDDGRCPTCHQEMTPEFTSSIGLRGSSEAAPVGEAPLSDVPLADLGLRVDEILPMRSGSDYRYVWLAELDERLPQSWRTPV